MKRLWNYGKRATASGWNAEGFSDVTSFLARSAHDHASGTRRLTGDTTTIARRASPHDGCAPHLAGGIPGYRGGVPGVTGDTSGAASGDPDLAMSLPDSAMSLPSAARCVSGLTDGVSGVDRYMDFNDLCGFSLFTAFPFGAVKQNTEKQQKNDQKQKNETNN